MAPPLSVQIRDVSKRFGATTVLDRVSLDIPRGEFIALLGPSGCGKTTLLRIIAGFEHPNGGDVLIDGNDVANQPAYARSTNMIFQHLALFPHMTVFENVAFGLRMKKVAAHAIGPKVREALDLVRLQGFDDRLPEQLSGGQKQRVAMARALVNDPSVLLLDEPLGALDLQLRLQLQVELRRLHKSLGSTFIFVTHDQVEAITMSDRIAVMNQGRIVQLGSPEEIYESPRARFVANFVGHTNVFDGKVSAIDADSTCVVTLNGGQARMRCSASNAVANGRDVAVALRYEKLSLTPDRTPRDGTSFIGIVKERTYMGGFIRFTIAADWGGEITADIPITVTARDVHEGSPVTACWSPSDATVLME